MALSVCLLMSLPDSVAADALQISTRPLPVLPDSPGVASAFSGICNGRLLLAGGANFPEAPPWKGGKKVWHDQVYQLEDETWRVIGKLDHSLAYGVSLQTVRGHLCIGGSDAGRHYQEVFFLTCESGVVKQLGMPSLPTPVANACGAVVGQWVIIAGGTDRPDATTALNSVFALHLSEEKPRWIRMADIPGPGRMLSVAAGTEDTFYLISGAALARGVDGKPLRTYLRDSWAFDLPTGKWTQLPDVPSACVAAPSPAPVIKQKFIVILGGDDGSAVGFQPPEEHPGFMQKAFIFDLQQRVWTQAKLPVSRVTVPLIHDGDRFVMPSGERQPGIRSPEVFEFRFESPR